MSSQFAHMLESSPSRRFFPVTTATNTFSDDQTMEFFVSQQKREKFRLSVEVVHLSSRVLDTFMLSAIYVQVAYTGESLPPIDKFQY